MRLDQAGILELAQGFPDGINSFRVNELFDCCSGNLGCGNLIGGKQDIPILRQRVHARRARET